MTVRPLYLEGARGVPVGLLVDGTPTVRPFIGFLQQDLDLPRRQGADQYPGRHQSLPLAIHATPNLENNDPLAKRKNRAIM